MKQLLFFLFFFFCTLPAPLWAAATPWQQDEDVSVRLLSAQNTTGHEKELLLGLEINLGEGWHSYWRSPGITGNPPDFDWSGSENFKSAAFLYPIPQRFGSPPLDAIGYKGNVVLPLRVTLQEKGKALTLKGQLNLLVCKELCLPKNFDLALTIPEGAALPSNENDLIDAALARLPKDAANASLRITKATTKDDTLFLEIESDKPLTTLDLFLENNADLLFGRPSIKMGPSGKRATLEVQLDEPLEDGEKLDPSILTATLINGDEALVQKLDTTTQPAPEILPFWCILLIALVGGFLLNLMPCVLPVLSLKIFGLIKHGRKGKRVIRRAFLSTASGILFSFLLLAMATIGLKASGQAIGWGVQFQQPSFLVFMIVILTFFAANLWGFFELGLPRFIQDKINPATHPKLASNFASGALATLLATPCSAPFLGTALSFALAAGWVEIISVFGTLGLGMSLPYLMVAIHPRMASFLPSPGPWMQTISRLLGFGLAGTALWLLFVLSAQIGNTGTALIAGGMVGLLGMIALRHRGLSKKILYPAVLLILSGVFILAFITTTPEKLAKDKGLWKTFSEEALARHLAEGKIVFVDVTADWCLTCKVNKRLAMANDAVSQKLFDNQKIVALQADWTNPDPTVTEFLHKHGRYGVPFNIIFNAPTDKGHVLPELLTPSIILDGLEKAQTTTDKPQ